MVGFRGGRRKFTVGCPPSLLHFEEEKNYHHSLLTCLHKQKVEELPISVRRFFFYLVESMSKATDQEHAAGQQRLAVAV